MQTTIASTEIANHPQPGAAPITDAAANRKLVEAMVKSKVYQDYERAFTETTGLPVNLRPVETWQLPHHGCRKENPFCSLLADRSRACATCLEVQDKLRTRAANGSQTIVCPVGLSDTAVPVKMGERLVGYLHTGQLFTRKPSNSQFERAASLASEWGVEADHDTMKQAYFAAKIIPPKQHESVVKLLEIFAQHLSMLSNQIFVQERDAEPPVIVRARAYITEHMSDELSLGQVAKAVNMSSFYFCKLFKKITGINYTDYLSRVRIEKAKQLLLNPNLRISEIAYEVGFQSLTHFNRVFRRILGQSPTEYRSHLLAH